MAWVRHSLLVALGCCASAGCANVKVKKVDADRRIEGKDQHVKGFRYYLNRPYVVVGKRVTVATTFVPVEPACLVKGPNQAIPGDRLVFKSLVPDSQKKILIFESNGTPIPGLGPNDVTAMGTNVATAPTVLPMSERDCPVLLARAVASRVDSLIRDEAARAGTPPDPSAYDALTTALTGAVSGKPVNATETLPDYGNRVMPDLQSVAKATGAGFVPAGPGRDRFQANVDGLKPALLTELFTPAQGATAPPSCSTLLAHAVGVALTDTVRLGEVNPAPTRRGELVESFKSAALREVQASALTGDARTREEETVRRALKGIQALTQPTPNSLKASEIATVRGQTLAAVTDRLLGPRPTTPPPPPAPAAAAAPTTLSALEAAAVMKGCPVSFTSLDNPDTAGPTPANDPNAMKVVFMPDFEEQYAIRNKNFLAKTKYQYVFRNGTELAAVSGNYNATDVPVKILETVGKLISAAGQVAQTTIDPTKAPLAAFGVDAPTAPDAKFYVRIERVIEPGVYRVQKSWEKAAAAPVEGLTTTELGGLFSDIGLPVLEVNSVLTVKQYAAELTALKAATQPTPPASAPKPAPAVAY